MIPAEHLTAHGRHLLNRRAFLNGEYGTHGWVAFFPYCLLVKTPLPLLFILLLGLAAAIQRLTACPDASARSLVFVAGLRGAAPLVALLIVYWYVALHSHLNVGERHLLPTYPAMYILAGAAIWWWRCPTESAIVAKTKPPIARSAVPQRLHGRWQYAARWVLIAAIAGLVGEALLVWPNYLAYFNIIAGGSRNGYRHLVDSSLDWGQDLPGLRDWLAATTDPNGRKRVYLSYFGTGDPTYYGILAQLLPSYFEHPPSPGVAPLEGGTYCVSATMLQGIYLRNPGPWDSTKESDYSKVLGILQAWDAVAADPAKQLEMRRQIGEQNLARLIRQFEEMRFNRLCHFLLQREPDHEIGYSILIYHLSDEDVQRYVFGKL